MTRPQQPLDTLTWRDPSDLRANDYNPNNVAPPELRLLKISILEDGWTQPIVARNGGEIVDGFHRWTLATTDTAIQNLTGGVAPVVYLPDGVDPAHQRMSTIRHNRARGVHHVVKMADIVNQLAETGMGPDEISHRLQMDPEEVSRLLDRGKMTVRHAADEFGSGWT